MVLLLLLLGLEYEPEELTAGLRANWPAGLVDLVTSFTPGYLAGVLLGWAQPAAVLLGGVTYISSSGIIAKLLSDLDRLGNRETPVILSILVIEAMEPPGAGAGAVAGEAAGGGAAGSGSFFTR